MGNVELECSGSSEQPLDYQNELGFVVRLLVSGK